MDVTILLIVSSLAITLAIGTFMFCTIHVKHLSHPDRRKKIKHMVSAASKRNVLNDIDLEAPTKNPVGPNMHDDDHHGAEIMMEMHAGMLITVKSNANLLAAGNSKQGSKWDIVRRNKTFFHHPDLQKTVLQLVEEQRKRDREQRKKCSI